MKIALVYDFIYPFYIGGVEIRNHYLANELKARGHDVTLYGRYMWDGPKSMVKSGIKYVGVGKRIYRFSGNRDPIQTYLFSRLLSDELGKVSYDAIDCTAFPYLPALACAKKQAQMIFTWHEVWKRRWSNKGILLNLTGKILEIKTARLQGPKIAVSQLVADKLLSIGAKDVTVIPNWVDKTAIERARPLKKKYDIVSVGRFLPHKNFKLLLKVITILKAKHKKIRCLIIGDGPEILPLLAMRNQLGLQGNVDILAQTPHHHQLMSYIKSSKIFVLLSELEGFSLITAEAMMCGLPAIVLSAPDNAATSLVSNGNDGYVCKPYEPEIAANISLLLKKTDLRKKMGKQAIVSASHYTSDKSIPNILKIYRSVSGK